MKNIIQRGVLCFISMMLLAAVMVLVTPSKISAKTYSYNGFYYTVSSSKITITKYKGTKTAVTVPSKINGKKVVAIAANAFKQNTKMTSVTVPTTVTSIGASAFNSCTKLKTAKIKGNIGTVPSNMFRNCVKLSTISITGTYTTIATNAFYGCSSITTFTVPETVTTIKANAFKDCDSLSSLSLPASLTSFSPLSLYGCTSLTNISIADGNATYVENNGAIYSADQTKLVCVTSEISEDYEVPANVTAIQAYAFAPQYVLNEITIPNTVTTIQDGAFSYGMELNTVILPTNITFVGAWFKYSGISYINIPEGVTVIDELAFFNSKNLASITLPSTLTEMYCGEGCIAFRGCDNLKSIKVASGNTSFYTKNGVLYYLENNTPCLMFYPPAKPATTFRIPDGVILTMGCFDHCLNLKKLYLPSDLTTLATTFSNCSNLQIVVPETVVNFVDEGHLTDFPIFSNCTSCYLLVYKNSAAYTFCRTFSIPYKVIS